MRKGFFFLLIILLSAPLWAANTQTEILYLSGRGSDTAVNWDFKVSAGRKANRWSTLPVPSNWELFGFGGYNYGHARHPATETGFYRYRFTPPSRWQDKRIFIVFEGAMTETAVKINGFSAGPPHQGGFYRFQYDITKIVKPGQSNLLEVRVSKIASDSTVTLAERRADYWDFGGIYRPVYLKAVPQEYIDWTAIDARANGVFRAAVHLGHRNRADRVRGQIFTLNGTPLGGPFSAQIRPNQSEVLLKTQLTGQHNWTAETPSLYVAEISLLHGRHVLHTIRQRFGFRTFSVVPGKGLFLNGKRIFLKGCDRHSFWPTTGRALNRNRCRDDILTMKAMNMNAVRMSHYPPDSYFLDLCDELGLYVLDELGGWHRPPYDTLAGAKLVAEMVKRDVNHPSILFWDNGNEGGWNPQLDDDFSRYDLQNRTVLHPGAVFDSVDARHYPTYKQLEKRLRQSTVLLPTEILHGLYDGGSGSGMDDYWHLLWGKPGFGGMFFWVFADEGVVRTDSNCVLDTDGNHAPDGILGPFHQKEASFYTIREIWSPVYIETDSTLPPNFSGRIPVENRYDFTNLNQCRFSWHLVHFPNPGLSQIEPQSLWNGSFLGPNLPPHQKGFVQIPLPVGWQTADALFLTAFGPRGKKLATWHWKWASPSELRLRVFSPGSNPPKLQKSRSEIQISAGAFTYIFGRHDGLLKRVLVGQHAIPFGEGPLFVSSAPADYQETNTPKQGKTHFRIIRTQSSVEMNVTGLPFFQTLRWEIFGSGWLKLTYTLTSRDTVDYLGISFDFPETQLNRMTWLGKGPYRVWKDRLKGQTVSIWQNGYKRFQAGKAWNYPEFAGYYADFNWVLFQTDAGPFFVATDSDSLFLRVSRQKNGVGARHTAMVWPKGTLSFLHAIPAMGSKFHTAAQFGPQGQRFVGRGVYSATLFFYFGLPK